MKNTALMVVVLLVVMGGGFYLYQNQKKSSMMNPEQNQTQNQSGKVIPTDGSVQSQTSVSEGLTLDVFTPKDGDTLSDSFVVVKGKTAANASVSINDSDVKADAQGNFLTKIDLDEGENIINVSANDNQGNYAEKELTVMMQSKQ